MNHNHYETLGLNPNATLQEIKKAYRKLSFQHHPDKTGGDAKIFNALNEAYKVLGDEEKRREYDRIRQSKPIENLKDVAHEVVGEYFNQL